MTKEIDERYVYMEEMKQLGKKNKQKNIEFEHKFAKKFNSI